MQSAVGGLARASRIDRTGPHRCKVGDVHSRVHSRPPPTALHAWHGMHALAMACLHALHACMPSTSIHACIALHTCHTSHATHAWYDMHDMHGNYAGTDDMHAWHDMHPWHDMHGMHAACKFQQRWPDHQTARGSLTTKKTGRDDCDHANGGWQVRCRPWRRVGLQPVGLQPVGLQPACRPDVTGLQPAARVGESRES